jgi:flagellar M-ring protein FliF
MNKNPFEALLSIFNKLTVQQKFIIGGVTGLTIILLGILIVFLNEPNYSPLYSNLSQEDASKVLDQLNSSKIPYKIDDNGKTIKVPKDKVYETRLELAGKGIPSQGAIGYELFDKNTMGMSDFMQKLNYKRALEGELSKTISQEEGVEGVRVHIVIPQKSVFKDEEKLPTASVVLKLKNNYNLTKTNIAAIINLVSSSVEGLQPGKVTLIDSKGRLLSKENSDEPLTVSSSKQYEVKQSVENYLASKAQTILDNIVGYGNAMVQVNADINFDQVEKTMETYDPNSQVAVSEQQIKTDNAGKNNTDSTTQVSQNSTTNYEISKSIEKVIQGSGNIKKLVVAAVINDEIKEIKNGDKVTVTTQPRTPDQMQKLEEIVKNSVGIDNSRPDQFSIVNIPFETKTVDDAKPQETSFLDNMDKWTNVILIVAGLLAAIIILKNLLNKLKNEKIIIGTFKGADLAFDTAAGQPDQKLLGEGQQNQIPAAKKKMLPVGNIEDEISEEAIMRKNQQEKISSYVSKNPVDAAKLINSWLHEDEY